MTDTRSLSPEDVAQSLRGPMGLIIGPGATSSMDFFSEASAHIAAELKSVHDQSLFTTGDMALDAGFDETAIIEQMCHYVEQLSPNPMLSTLAKARWSAVLSICIDDFLEAQMRQATSTSAVMRPVRVVTDFLAADPGRVTPVYKLLGSADRRKIICTTSGRVLSQATWRHAVQGFAERVKGNAVLCIGFDNAESLFQDIQMEFIANPRTIPSMMLFLADDVLLNNASVQRTFKGRVRISSILGSVGQLVNVVSSAQSRGFPATLPFPKESEPLKDLAQFDDLVSIVNLEILCAAPTTERTLLLDLLFSPDIPRWDPYVHNLDFRRSISQDLLRKILGRCTASSRTTGAVVVRGAAASGKTTVLRRLSHDLAKSGFIVLWLKTSYLPDSTNILVRLFKELATRHEKRQVCIVIDDPLVTGTSAVQSIYSACTEHNVDVLVVVGIRDTEWMTADSSLILSRFDLIDEVETPVDLSPDEWAELPRYLVQIGASPNESAALSDVAAVESRSARDTLSTLYFLLPQTKSKIASAVRDEYVRLGDLSSVQTIVLGGTNHSTNLLKEAYGLVAVADKYSVPLPIEVLVAALGVDYTAWLDVAKSGGPAWGILYSFDSQGGECYRTRNSLVTRFIVTAINGGELKRLGETRLLQATLKACTSRTTPVYREFCARLLIRNPTTESLEYSEGMQLFDAAVEALPFDDKAILHHRALWVKNKGDDPIRAIALLKECLTKADYPYCDKRELNEHIHNSLAACYVAAIDRGLIEIGEGKDGAFHHIDKARTESFQNINTVHVQAELSRKLIDKLPVSDVVDKFEIAARSLADIDNTLALIGHGIRPRSREDIDYLENARDKLFIAVSVGGDANHSAEELWEQQKIQEGFVVVARKLLRDAVARNNGSDFLAVHDYVSKCCRRVRESGESPTPNLLDANLQVYYRWRINRQVFSGTVAVDWDLVESLSQEVIATAGKAASPMHHYIRALALAHKGKWSDADVIFAQLRRQVSNRAVLWTRRDFLLEENGKARQVQGTIRTGADRPTFYSEELLADFPADSSGKWNRQGEDEFAYIQFSLGGPTAIDRYSLTSRR